MNQELRIRNESEQGFIALISAIVISLILLGLVFLLSSGGYFARAASADGEYKRVSLGLAESCANEALLKVADNYNYQLTADPGYSATAGGVVIPVGAQSCVIKSVAFVPSTSSETASISAQANYEGSFSTINVSSLIQNPTQVYVPPTNLTATVIVPPGATAPKVIVDGNTVNSGTSVTVASGTTHNVSVAAAPTGPNTYTTTGWAGACGGAATAGTSNSSFQDNHNNSCYITYVVQPTTANITIIGNFSPAGGASTLTIDGQGIINGQGVAFGQQLKVAAGTHTISATTPNGYQASSWSGSCSGSASAGTITSLTAGSNYSCVINFTQPNTACADTVMMFDRTGSMSATDLANENAAAKALFGVYSGVTTPAKIGIGSMGGLDGSAASVPTTPVDGQLTTAYGNDVGTGNLPASFPTAAAAIPTGQWTNPANAFASDTLFSTDATTGHVQGYNKFNFATSTIPTGATITGIAVVADGKVTASSQTLNSGFLTPSSVSSDYDQWTAHPINSAANRASDVSTNDGNTTYIDSSTLNQGETYNISLSSLPAGAVINSVTMYAYAEGTAAGATLKFRVENSTANGHQNDDTAHALNNGSYPATPLSRGPMNINPLTNAAWTTADFSTTHFGIVRANTTGGTPRVTNFYVVINYTFTPVVSGSLGVNLSWNNGTSWSTGQTASLAPAEAAYTLGGSTNLWGESWSINDFSNSNFVLKLTNNYTGGAIAAVNYVTVQIYYSVPATGLYAAINTITGSNSTVGSNLQALVTAGYGELISSRHVAGNKRVLILVSDGEPSKPTGNLTTDTNDALAAANTAKSAGVLIFSVRYSQDTNPQGIALMQNLSSNSSSDYFPNPSPTAAQMQIIFTQIANAVCPAAAASTQANLNVTAQVINSYGGTAGPGAFPVTVTNSLSSVAPTLQATSTDGSSISYTYPPFLTGNSLNVSEVPPTGYYAPQYVGCPGQDISANIPVGQSVYCTIINYDQPPAPATPAPPPPSNIGINSWTQQQ